ncbi:MAG: 30S ribosomal protein S17 [Caldiserica bacterium]|jgi:small subunit ribosomal protein S17|nr:30S ribosomal protein S17 [Caldisericota bacterium]MDH7563131.1 30S ribosomal protein S17 [Caldisericota bacterium]
MSKAKVILGKVLSNKMEKTVVIGVERRFKHPRYGKVISKLTKLYAHSEKPLNPGDVVEVVQTRPLSKLKRWMVLRVVTKGMGDLGLPTESEEISND